MSSGRAVQQETLSRSCAQRPFLVGTGRPRRAAAGHETTLDTAHGIVNNGTATTLVFYRECAVSASLELTGKTNMTNIANEIGYLLGVALFIFFIYRVIICIFRKKN